MPVYHLSSDDLDALTTALLSMTGAPATAGLQKLVVSRSEASFHPAGEFGRVYERYKCYVCHQFNGFGGTLAPDLSYEGSRAQRQWLIDFLKDPKTVRPTLVLRMPQFNMTDQEAATLAAYIGTALNSPDVDPAAIDTKQFTPEKAALGKQLYEVKYECQSCHTIGATGGYVGPNLNNAGNWLTPAWIEAWLRNPQKLVPDTIEPRRAFQRRRDTGPDGVSADAARVRQASRFCAGRSHRVKSSPRGEPCRERRRVLLLLAFLAAGFSSGCKTKGRAVESLPDPLRSSL